MLMYLITIIRWSSLCMIVNYLFVRVQSITTQPAHVLWHRHTIKLFSVSIWKSHIRGGVIWLFVIEEFFSSFTKVIKRGRGRDENWRLFQKSSSADGQEFQNQEFSPQKTLHFQKTLQARTRLISPVFFRHTEKLTIWVPYWETSLSVRDSSERHFVSQYGAERHYKAYYNNNKKRYNHTR